MFVIHPGTLERIQVEAIIDTGATDSVIRSDIAQKLNLPLIDSQKVETVGGAIEQSVVAAALVLPDEISGDGPSKIARLICADQMTDPMLFGMDLMIGGVLTVDMIQHTWNWKLKRVKK